MDFSCAQRALVSMSSFVNYVLFERLENSSYLIFVMIYWFANSLGHYYVKKVLSYCDLVGHVHNFVLDPMYLFVLELIQVQDPVIVTVLPSLTVIV